MAGVIGTSKFAYDIWGDTVNTASRMESQWRGGKRFTSLEEVYSALKGTFVFEEREIEVMGKGMMRTYFLLENNVADRSFPLLILQYGTDTILNNKFRQCHEHFLLSLFLILGLFPMSMKAQNNFASGITEKSFIAPIDPIPLSSPPPHLPKASAAILCASVSML